MICPAGNELLPPVAESALPSVVVAVVAAVSADETGPDEPVSLCADALSTKTAYKSATRHGEKNWRLVTMHPQQGVAASVEVQRHSGGPP